MARHNREGSGEDQRGHSYTIEYQPDWLHQIKVTRELGSGRQSTKTLFRNPDRPEQDPGPKVRTRIQSPELGIDLQIAFVDEKQHVRRLTIETKVATGAEKGEVVVFSLSRARQASKRPSPTR